MYGRNTVFPQMSLILKTSLRGSEVRYQRNFNSPVRVNCFSRDYLWATNLTIILLLTGFQRTLVQLISKPCLPTSNPKQSVLSYGQHPAQISCSSRLTHSLGSASTSLWWAEDGSALEKCSMPGRIEPSCPGRPLGSGFLQGAVIRQFVCASKVQQPVASKINTSSGAKQLPSPSLWTTH